MSRWDAARAVIDLARLVHDVLSGEAERRLRREQFANAERIRELEEQVVRLRQEYP